MVSLHYEITKEDYVQYYMYMLWDAKGRKKKRLKNYLRQSLYNLVFLGLFIYVGSRRFDNFTILIGCLLFAISFLPFISSRSNMEKQAAAITEDPDNSNIFSEHTLIATDADLHIRSPFCETKFSWKGFLKKAETKTHFLLFINALQGVIIPKRAFSTADDLSEFQKILSRNLSLQAELKDDDIDG